MALSRSLTEARIRVPTFFGFVYFCRGTLPQKRGKRALLGDLVVVQIPFLWNSGAVAQWQSQFP